MAASGGCAPGPERLLLPRLSCDVLLYARPDVATRTGYGLEGRGRFFVVNSASDPDRPARLNAAAEIVRGPPTLDAVAVLVTLNEEEDGAGYSGGVPYVSDSIGEGVAPPPPGPNLGDSGCGEVTAPPATPDGETLRGCVNGATGGDNGLGERPIDSGRIGCRLTGAWYGCC